MLTLRTHIMIFGGMNGKLLQKIYLLKNAKKTCKPNNRDWNIWNQWINDILDWNIILAIIQKKRRRCNFKLRQTVLKSLIWKQYFLRCYSKVAFAFESVITAAIPLILSKTPSISENYWSKTNCYRRHYMELYPVCFTKSKPINKVIFNKESYGKISFKNLQINYFRVF